MRPEGRIEITYEAEAIEGGYRPSITVNGHRRPTYVRRPMDRQLALDLAVGDAEDEAEKYRGEWDVTVEEVQSDGGRVLQDAYTTSVRS